MSSYSLENSTIFTENESAKKMKSRLEQSAWNNSGFGGFKKLYFQELEFMFKVTGENSQS